MDSPTPDSGNTPDTPLDDPAAGNAGTAASADDAPIDVKPRKEDPPKQKPVTDGDSKAAQAPPPGAEGNDEVLYRGSVSLWLGWRSFGASIAAAILGLVLLFTGIWFKKDVTFFHYLGIYVGLPLFIAALLMCGYVFLSLRCLRYKITNRLIERERGILVKRVDRLDLARVKDVQLVQNLFERVLRIGTIEILSSDRTDPLMRLEAIPKPRPIYEKLSDTVIKISQKRGIIAMDR